jgi:hypothetical protein
MTARCGSKSEGAQPEGHAPRGWQCGGPQSRRTVAGSSAATLRNEIAEAARQGTRGPDEDPRGDLGRQDKLQLHVGEVDVGRVPRRHPQVGVGPVDRDRSAVEHPEEDPHLDEDKHLSQEAHRKGDPRIGMPPPPGSPRSNRNRRRDDLISGMDPSAPPRNLLRGNVLLAARISGGPSPGPAAIGADRKDLPGGLLHICIRSRQDPTAWNEPRCSGQGLRATFQSLTLRK